MNFNQEFVSSFRDEITAVMGMLGAFSWAIEEQSLPPEPRIEVAIAALQDFAMAAGLDVDAMCVDGGNLAMSRLNEVRQSVIEGKVVQVR